MVPRKEGTGGRKEKREKGKGEGKRPVDRYGVATISRLSKKS